MLNSSEQFELEEELTLIESEQKSGSGDRTKARKLINQGWRIVYAELFGQPFVEVLASHHIEAVEWHFTSRLLFLQLGQESKALENQLHEKEITRDTFEQLLKLAKKKYRPEYLAYFPIWSRGHMKSSLAERMVTVDAVLSYSYEQPGFCLYLGREKTKVKENVSNIETLFSSAAVRKYAPELSQVARNEETDSKRQWTGTFLHTKAKYVVKGGTVESAQAGSRVEETRPTFIILDDIDGREDSPAIADTRFKLLTGEILPMRQWNTLVFWAQNLISRFSCMYRVYKQHVRVLTNRKPTKLVPAVLNFKSKEITVNGVIQDVYESGTPTWKAWDEQRINDEIQTEGLESFLKECQHEVEQSREGLVHKKYDDNVHPISYSQFAARYGTRDAWKAFAKIPLSDWARTKTKYHANVAGYLMVSSQNSVLPGFTFFLPLSFKKDTAPADVAERLLTVLTPYAHEGRTWKALIDDAWKRTNAQRHFNTESERWDFLKKTYSQLIPQYSRKVLKKYNVKTGANSHSEDKVREIFNHGFGFSFIPSNPSETAALEDIDEAMRVDYKLRHIFDPEKMGYTRWYVLCADDLKKDPKIINGIKVYPPVPYPDDMKPDDLHDDALFRYQMCNRMTNPPELTKTGEKIDVLFKANDDFGQMLQFAYFKKLLANIPLTTNERVQESLPDVVKPLVGKRIMTMGEQMALEDEMKAAKKKVKKAYDPRLNSLGEDFPDEVEDRKFPVNFDDGGFDDIYS